MSLQEQNAARRARHVFLLFAEALIIVYLAVNALVAPVYRPLQRWFSKLEFVTRLQDRVAELPPYAILVLLGVPFAIAEPAKLWAVILFATGHEKIGIAIFVLAYFVTFVVIERVYSAGRDKLRTIRWFAKSLDWLFAFRDQVLAWVRATEAWALFHAVKRRIGDVIWRLRVRLGLG
jgi:hypothetical protein